MSLATISQDSAVLTAPPSPMIEMGARPEQLERKLLKDSGIKVYTFSLSKLKENEPEREEPKILNYFTQKKVEKWVNRASFVVMLKGISDVAAAVATFISTKLRKARVAVRKFSTFHGLGFQVLGIDTSIYIVYAVVIGFRQARKNRDSEEMRDRSVQLLSSAANITDTSICIASFGLGLRKSTHALAQSATLAGIGAVTGAAIWGIFLAVQALAVRRIQRASNRLKAIFAVGSENEKEKVIKGIEHLRDLVRISTDEKDYVKSVTNKLKGLAGQALDEKKNELKIAYLEKKKNKLEKRVGSDVSAKIQDIDFDGLLAQLRSDDKSDFNKGLSKSKDLLKHYQNGLRKELKIRLLKIVGAALGFSAAILSFSNPISAAIVTGVATAIMIYAWYQNKYKGADTFAKTRFLGFRLLNYAVGEVRCDDPKSPRMTSGKSPSLIRRIFSFSPTKPFEDITNEDANLLVDMEPVMSQTTSSES